MRIRAYQNSDAGQIRRMLDSLCEYAGSILEDDLKEFEEFEDRGKALDFCIGLNRRRNWKTFVCEGPGGGLLGFITGGLEKEIPGYKIAKYGKVEIFYVEEAFRGRKIGRKLMENMQAWFKKRGCDALMVDTWASNRSARSAYEKLGFKKAAVIFVKKAAE